MYLGVDLGTSSVKAIIIDDDGVERAGASASLAVSRPQLGWSEQDPDEWVSASEQAVLSLPADLRAAIGAVGFSGQMHGATLLGHDDRPLRPAILWNDTRSNVECAELEAREPQMRAITGNKAMPGFTAPKLAWVRKHEPKTFANTRRVLLPKDYVRLVWTGDHASDVSDASGTLWLATGERHWSEPALAACDLDIDHMPELFESHQATGTVSASVAQRLGIPQVPVAAGAGDQAAGAIGAGVIAPGEAVLALGTSGVIFRVTDAFQPNAKEAAHAFCHAVPNRWHQMAVLLSAASAVDWAASLCGFGAPSDAYHAAEQCGPSGSVLFYPYLSGERTPHDFATPAGVLLGMSASDGPAQILHAVLEGVAFAFADGRDTLERAGGPIAQASVQGGGSRSLFWGQMLADVLGITLTYRTGAAAGPALGAARLAMLCVDDRSIAEVCTPGEVEATIDPDPKSTQIYAERLAHWRSLFVAMKPHIEGHNRI